MASRARAQSLATVLVLELVDAVFRIRFDYEHRFAEHEHEYDFLAPIENLARLFRSPEDSTDRDTRGPFVCPSRCAGRCCVKSRGLSLLNQEAKTVRSTQFFEHLPFVG
jgi:hypothetical protein